MLKERTLERLNSSALRSLENEFAKMTTLEICIVKVFLFFVIIDAIIYDVRAETDPFNVITSSGVCLSDVECPTAYSCHSRRNYPQYQCNPRSGLNESCFTNPVSSAPVLCQEGLFCSSGVCRPTLPVGATCTISSDCGPTNYCSLKDRKCERLGKLGASCMYDSECNVDAGFYCNTSQQKCVRRKPTGKNCDPENQVPCSGYCDSLTRRCVETKSELESCTSNEQCSRFPMYRGDRVYDNALCNIAKGSSGICVTESRLIKVLGARCSITKDKCDARRGLSCRWSSKLRKAVCQQFKKPNDNTSAYCTPENELSRCVDDSSPRGCRLPEYDNMDPDGYLERLFYRCLRAFEIVPRGAICNRAGFEKCQDGTSCRTIIGVTELQFRTRPPRLATCVQVKQLGESCSGSKFRTQCDYGLNCKQGVCVQGKPKETLPTHADIDDDCSKLPCVPGAVCEDGGFLSDRACTLPTKSASEGKICFNTARFYRVSFSPHFLISNFPTCFQLSNFIHAS